MHLFSLNGRVGRRYYFLHSAISFMLFIIAVLLLSTTVVDSADPPSPNAAALVLLVLFILLDGISEISVTVRRLHDLDRSGWHYFLFVIPFYNIYLAFVLFFKRGTVGPNQYGPDPVEEYSISYQSAGV